MTQDVLGPIPEGSAALFAEVAALKRVPASAAGRRSLADVGFRRAWGRLLAGEPPDRVAATEIAFAAVHVALGPADAAALTHAGADRDARRSIYTRAAGKVFDPLDEPLLAALDGLVRGAHEREPALPAFVEAMSLTPRVRLGPEQAPGDEDMQGEHAWVTAVIGAFLARMAGHPSGGALVLGLVHGAVHRPPQQADAPEALERARLPDAGEETHRSDPPWTAHPFDPVDAWEAAHPLDAMGVAHPLEPSQEAHSLELWQEAHPLDAHPPDAVEAHPLDASEEAHPPDAVEAHSPDASEGHPLGAQEASERDVRPSADDGTALTTAAEASGAVTVLSALPPELAKVCGALLERHRDVETVAGRAFQAADLIDRVLQERHYANTAGLSLSDALDEDALVGSGPLRRFHRKVLRQLGMVF